VCSPGNDWPPKVTDEFITISLVQNSFGGKVNAYGVSTSARDYICSQQIGFPKARQRKYNQFLRSGKTNGDFSAIELSDIRSDTRVTCEHQSSDGECSQFSVQFCCKQSYDSTPIPVSTLSTTTTSAPIGRDSEARLRFLKAKVEKLINSHISPVFPSIGKRMKRWLKKKVEKMIIDYQNKEISCQKNLIEDENMRISPDPCVGSSQLINKIINWSRRHNINCSGRDPDAYYQKLKGQLNDYDDRIRKQMKCV